MNRLNREYCNQQRPLHPMMPVAVCAGIAIQSFAFQSRDIALPRAPIAARSRPPVAMDPSFMTSAPLPAGFSELAVAPPQKFSHLFLQATTMYIAVSGAFTFGRYAEGEAE